MTQVLIVVAVIAAGVFVARRVLRHAPATRPIDVGAVSIGWIAEHRREEPPR